MDLTIRRGDVVHLGLLALSAALSYVFPFELLLLSYIVLGPAHYYTEISWLHDRKYFMPHRGPAVVLALAALGGMFIADPWWSGVLVWSCLIGAAIAALGLSAQRSAMLATVAAALTLGMAAGGAPFVLIAVLLPTFIHVSIFTLVFMTLGALRARSAVQLVIVGAYLAVIAAILIVPPSSRTLVAELARLASTISAPWRRSSAAWWAFPTCPSPAASPACCPSSTPITTSTGSSKPTSSAGRRCRARG